jgi:CobQ-like glutamine amidotransferase family enzyme
MKIVRIYNELLGTYGDRGNAEVAAFRASNRGIKVELIDVNFNDYIPTDGDLYFLGGAEDKAQIIATKKLKNNQILNKLAADGKVILAICAAYQIFGESYFADGEIQSGLGILPIETRAGAQRYVGELLVESSLGKFISGFENHGGLTKYLGNEVTPFGKVLSGFGNGDQKFDGAIVNHVYGTYLHGPVLARNPELADKLIENALDQKLPDFSDELADRYHNQRVEINL